MSVPRLIGRAALGALIIVAATALPAPGARADGPRTPFVVARGHSLYGAPWRIRFGEEPGHDGAAAYGTFLFSIGDRAERDRCSCGYYASIPLPLPRRFTFSPGFGSDFDRFPESDMSGTAGPRVARLVLAMADGSSLDAELLSPPRRLVAGHPRLGRLRFFDLFFPAADEPVSVTAYGRRGGTIEAIDLGGR